MPSGDWIVAHWLLADISSIIGGVLLMILACRIGRGRRERAEGGADD